MDMSRIVIVMCFFEFGMIILWPEDAIQVQLQCRRKTPQEAQCSFEASMNLYRITRRYSAHHCPYSLQYKPQIKAVCCCFMTNYTLVLVTEKLWSNILPLSSSFPPRKP
jgi:hypothetical protein